MEPDFTHEEASEASRLFCEMMFKRGWCVYALFADFANRERWRLCGDLTNRTQLASALRDAAFQCETSANGMLN